MIIILTAVSLRALVSTSYVQTKSAGSAKAPTWFLSGHFSTQTYAKCSKENKWISSVYEFTMMVIWSFMHREYNLCYFIYLLCWATESESLACYAGTTCNALSKIKEDQFRLVPGKTELILIAENIIVDGPDIYLFAHYFLHSFHRAQNWGRRL